MIDYNFTEANKRSSSGLYVARLFRIPDADDGSIRMSIEISKYHGGYVIFQLPDKYWLGTSEQLDWDARQDILFWTCNDKKRVFIYDVTFDTYIGADTKLKEKDRLGWDEEQKCWIRHDFLYTINYQPISPASSGSPMKPPINLMTNSCSLYLRSSKS